MIYKLETLVVAKMKMELETAEMSMLSFSLGLTKMEQDYEWRILRAVQYTPANWQTEYESQDSDGLNTSKGGILLREKYAVGTEMWWRPRRRYMDMIKEDVGTGGMTKEMAENRQEWRKVIRGGITKESFRHWPIAVTINMTARPEFNIGRMVH